MKHFFTLLLLTSLLSLTNTRIVNEDDKYIEINLDFITEDEDQETAVQEDFMEDVMSNYVFSDENVARYANEEDDHSLMKRDINQWESRTRPELHFLYYAAIIIVVILVVVGLVVWICCPCGCCKTCCGGRD